MDDRDIKIYPAGSHVSPLDSDSHPSESANENTDTDKGAFTSAMAPRKNNISVRCLIEELSRDLRRRIDFSTGSEISGIKSRHTAAINAPSTAEMRPQKQGQNTQNCDSCENNSSHMDMPTTPQSDQHAPEKNELSRTYLQQFLKEAVRDDAPYISLSQLVEKNPEHWQIEPRWASDYARLQEYYNSYPGLNTEHKKLLKIHRVMSNTQFRLDSIPIKEICEKSNGTNSVHYELMRRSLEIRMIRLKEAVETQRADVEKLFGGSAKAQQFLDFYNDFSNRYIHPPFNPYFT